MTMLTADVYVTPSIMATLLYTHGSLTTKLQLLNTFITDAKVSACVRYIVCALPTGIDASAVKIPLIPSPSSVVSEITLKA